MARTSDSRGSHWLVEPPGSEWALITVGVAEDAELTPQMRAALDGLVQAIEGLPDPNREVEGFRGMETCPGQTLCSPLTRSPCLKKHIISCTIVNCPSNVNCPWNDSF